MRRFFVPPADLRGETVPLGAETAQHLGTVLRLGPGAEILLLDGEGTVCRCVVESLGRRGGAARVLERRREAETALPVHLLQGLPKGEKMELVLQKGTELGITAFTPVLAGRGVAVPPVERGAKRLERWARIVREAARQCGRPCLPLLSPPLPLAEALAGCRQELRLMLWEEESRPLAEVLPAGAPRDVALLVGPEGGFAAAEAQAALRAGFVPVRLGPRILRTETAGLAAAAILQYRYGDLGPAR
jgi:16S rRNA (uracil1498-N3)-methyltransferase